MYILYGHGGSGNHGCEAIVRSTINMLDQPVKLFSADDQQDIKYGINKLCTIIPDKGIILRRGSKEWFLSVMQTKLTGKIDKEVLYRNYNLLGEVDSNALYFSIGGDNYCYPGTEILAAERNNIQRHGTKVVLWGCSVEPQLFDNSQIVKDIGAYDLITVRESLSYEAVRKVNDNAVLVTDPAFTLPREDLPLPVHWKAENMVGINASPLILDSASDGNLIFEAYSTLIQYILDNTSYGIALIPHVVWEYNDDRKPLKLLYERFAYSDRIVLLDDYNCMQLKGYIARCRFFVGARTHATIAAYSSCVPTLVLGYSVKSKGIAQDLFGTDEHYVLPVQRLKYKEEIVKEFQWLMENEENIQLHLKAIMPDYIKRAFLAKDILKKIL